MKTDSQRIISDFLRGPGRATAYKEERARLVAEARQRRADELGRASTWRRVSINWQIEREVRAMLEKKFPKWALYAARGRL